MPRLDRRVLLTNVFIGASFLLAGCSSRSGTDPPDETVATEDTSLNRSSPAADERTVSTPVESNIEANCITSEFTGYIGTTPLPAPEKPDEMASGPVVDYAISYERYYERYLALYEIGVPTPEEENHPAHGFPDVRLADFEHEVVAETDGRFVVRLAFSRFFENEPRGEYTVTYYVSDAYTIRAEVEGRVYPGPDPLSTGERMAC